MTRNVANAAPGAKAAGDGAPRIEATPEMVKVGVEALLRFNPDLEGEEEAVVRIFQAMRRAEIEGQPVDPS